MSTRSYIGYVRPSDGKVLGIYCHSDGYLDHNGKILNKHYRDQSKVEQLIALGDISSLGEEIGEKHSFDGPSFIDEPAYKEYKEKYGKMCRAYHRDREEEFSLLERENENEFFAKADEIAYLFRDGEWFYRNTKAVQPLSEALNGKEEE